VATMEALSRLRAEPRIDMPPLSRREADGSGMEEADTHHE
jgi:hypothetical protein